MTEEERLRKRAQLKEDYGAIKGLAKAPAWRRGGAAMLDLYIAFALFLIAPDRLPLGLPHAFCLLYILSRDLLTHGGGLGKLVFGLRVYDYRSLELATSQQALIRNAIYATICTLLFGLSIGFAAAVVVFLPLGLFTFLLLFSRWNLLGAIGYNSDDGRTIPDDWAGTHVLTPKERTIIRSYEQRIRDLGADSAPA